MTLFKQYKSPVGTYHPMGNRRVYSTKWLNAWVNVERDRYSIGPNGEYLNCYRVRDNGRTRRVYMDMSMANIDIQTIDLPEYNPIDTPFMKRKYRGIKLCRKDLAEMIPSKLERFIRGLGQTHDRTNSKYLGDGRKK